MATQASPLPQPQQVPTSPMDQMILAAANAVNGGHPEIVSGVAQSSQNIGEAVTNSQAAAQLTTVQNKIDDLHNMAPKEQQTLWDQLTAPEQSMFKSAGYTPPAPHRSLWGDITHDASDAVATVAHGVGDVFNNRGVKDVLNAAGSPLRAVQHFERAALAEALIGHDQVQALFSPKDWSEGWAQTTNGEQYITPTVKRQAYQRWGSDTYNLAYQLATGKTIQELTAGMAPAQAQALYQQTQTKNVQDAKTFLDNGHVSVGRAILHNGFMERHPAVGRNLSGSIDALFDLGTDPTVMGGAGAGEAAKFRYLVRTPEDVQRLYDTRPAVQRAFADMAESVRLARAGDSAGMTALLDRYALGTGAVKNAVAQLIPAAADTQERVLQFFKDAAKTADTLSGNPMAEMVGQQLPHLNRIGYGRLSVTAPAKGLKSKMAERINWAAEHELHVDGVTDGDVLSMPGQIQLAKNRLILGTGKFLKMGTTLVNQGGVFDPHAPDAANVLRDIAREFLPVRVADQHVYDFVKDQDIANKWKVFRSVMTDMGRSAGLDANQDLWDTWIGKYDSTYGRIYAPKGHDIQTVDDVKQHVGLLEQDMADRWAVPRYRDLVIQGRKATGTQSLTGAINREWMDTFMNYWRPLTLAHPGFAFRVGGEEALGQILRSGPVSYLKASAARSYAKSQIRNELERRSAADAAEAASTPEDLQDARQAEMWNVKAAHLPTSITDRIHNFGDLWRESMVDNVRRALSATNKALTPETYRRYIDIAIRNGLIDDHLLDDVTAMHGYDPGRIDGDLDSGRFMRAKVNGKNVLAELKPGDEYKLYHPGDSLYHGMWYRTLHRLATDGWGREALYRGPYNGDFSLAGRVARVADRLEADPRWREQSVRAVRDDAGRSVTTGEITQRQAAENHASNLIKLADSFTRYWDEDENKFKDIPGLREHLLKNGKPPTIAVLEQTDYKMLPRSVQGPETLPVIAKENVINRATGWLFKHQIGPQINWMSRQPMFWHNYAEAWQEYEPTIRMMRKAGMSEEDIEAQVHLSAAQQAVERTMKYVHNPELRSQMSSVTRNLSPFWFAQEQFYKRWARTFYYSPQAFREGQLLSQGIRHSGFVHVDPENNQEYFVYPGSALVQDTLTHALPFMNAVVPVQAGLVGQVNMLNPGLERLGLPQYGPLVNVPMDTIKQIDPHLTAEVDAIQGSQAASSGYLKAIFPATVMHLINIALPQATAQAEIASAQMQAIQYLETTGHGMGTPATTPVQSMDIPNPTPGDYYMPNNVGAAAYVYQPDGTWKLNNSRTQQEYLTRIRNWSRIFLVTRAVFGFAAPAAPEAQFNPGNLNNEFQTLLKQLPFDVAVSTFLAAHPNATPLTVFQSRSKTGGTLPATQAAMNFLTTNGQLVNNHPLAATYFIPQPDTQGNFSLPAYQEQLAEGLRQKKDPATFYNEVVYQGAAQIYFQVENQKNQMIANHTMSTRAIDDKWTQWSQHFMQANPIFATMYGQSGSPGVVAASQAGRQQIMQDVGGAVAEYNNGQLNISGAGAVEQIAALNLLYNNWAEWQSLTQSYGNPNTPAPTATMINNIDMQFALWLQNFIQQYPGTQNLIDRAIRPDLSKALTDLAAQGTTVTI